MTLIHTRMPITLESAILLMSSMSSMSSFVVVVDVDVGGHGGDDAARVTRVPACDTYDRIAADTGAP